MCDNGITNFIPTIKFKITFKYKSVLVPVLHLCARIKLGELRSERERERERDRERAELVRNIEWLSDAVL